MTTAAYLYLAESAARRGEAEERYGPQMDYPDSGHAKVYEGVWVHKRSGIY